MKWLFLLFLIGVAVVLISARYRRQIQTGIYLFKMFKGMRRTGGAQERQIQNRANSKDVQLVRCARCGTWTPQSNALNLRGKTFYCSANCMETAVKAV
jgi:hypothetical protein